MKPKRLNELEASQRATAKALGVNHTTVMRDLKDGADAPKPEEEPLILQEKKSDVGANAPPPPSVTLDGSKVARAVQRSAEKKAKKRADPEEPTLSEAMCR